MASYLEYVPKDIRNLVEEYRQPNIVVKKIGNDYDVTVVTEDIEIEFKIQAQWRDKGDIAWFLNSRKTDSYSELFLDTEYNMTTKLNWRDNKLSIWKGIKIGLSKRLETKLLQLLKDIVDRKL